MAAADRIAGRRGIRLGMTLADARGSVPDLAVVDADEAADLQLLESIADWCDRYTPLVALDPPLGLFLDISGCAHLFAGRGHDEAVGEGEAMLLHDCLRRLAAQGFDARGAVASTPGVAWALAHYGGGGCVPAGGEAEALACLPVAALRVTPEQEDLLKRLGLKHIGQLIGLPRAPLAARFGASLLLRLDQAFGREDEGLSPRRPAPHFSAERRFAEPVADLSTLLEIVRSLAGSLESSLERRGLGARVLEASFFRIDGHVPRATLGTAGPIRAPSKVAQLFAERLAALAADTGSDWDAGYGFDMVRLAVLRTDTLEARQIDFAGEGSAGPDLTHLVDRLGARLGAARITRFIPVDTHIPERAARGQTLAEAAAPAPSWSLPDPAAEAPPDRPLRLFSRPEPVEVVAEVPEGPPLRFRWRRVLHEVARAEGPERIAAEWWQANRSDATRDYYRVEDAEGRRYWLFREGLYGRETDNPAWYVHGLFG